MADSQALQLLKSLRAARKPVVDFGQAVAQGGAEGLVQNLLGVPEFLARGARGGANVIRAATGNEPIAIPPGGLLGLPTGRETLAGVESGIGGLLGTGERGFGDFGPRFEEAVARREQTAQQRPIATGIGGVGADVATLASGRAPLVRGPGGFFDKPVASAVDDLSAFLTTSKPTGVKAFAKPFVDSDFFKAATRGLGRAAETGVEGATLALLQQGDPLDTAALAAGAQVGASIGLSIARESVDFPFEAVGLKAPKGVKGKLGGLIATAALTGGMVQLFKSLTPGGRDRILESDETGYQKVAATLLLGMVGGLLGKRPKAGGFLAAFPKFADTAATIPRAAMLSVLEDLVADQSGIGDKALSAIMQNPGAFTEKQTDILMKGIRNGNFLDAVNKLAEQDEDFVRIIDAPHPKLSDVPVRE